MLNGLGGRIENIDITGLVFNPNMVLVILGDGNDQIRRECRGVLKRVIKGFEMDTVIAGEAIAGAYPYEAILVLGESGNKRLGQALPGGDDPLRLVERLGNYGDR
jgi:hypothetical protein